MTLQAAEPQTKRWTRDEFYELAEQGYFRGKRVQLIDGEIIEMAPQGHAHARAIMYLTRWAFDVFGNDALVRIQMPLNAAAWSDPEPDIAIVPGPIEAYLDHPETATLVIEVSDSSIHLDRRKSKVYDGAGVGEYWIVNLQEAHFEAYRRGAAGERFQKPLIFKRDQKPAPTTRPSAVLNIDELLG